MASVLVISSYVAASSVGGGLAPYVLAPLGVEAVLVPTTLLGRHPGWGPPGGGPVTVDQMSGMLDGIEANGCFADVGAVLTGYVATREQATLAAEAIDRVRTTLRQGPTPLVLVDPIMGDEGVGLYVPEEVASAQAMLLVPRADLAACNLWEFQQLVGTQDASTPEQIAALARGTGRDWLITSVSTDHGVGALLVDGAGARLALAQRVAGRLPRGTGDLLKLRFVGGLLAGEDRTLALQRSVGLVAAVLERAAAMQSAELPLISCRDLLADAPGGWLQPVAC